MNIKPLILLITLLFSTPIWAHQDIHSTEDILFPSNNSTPIITSNWGFFSKSNDNWNWLCPEAVDTTALYQIAVTQDNRWLIATLDGLWESEDKCNFSMDHFTGEYVRQIEIQEDEIWVSTATGFSDNALWYSSDNGVSYSAIASFGYNSRLYSFAISDDIWWVLSAIEDNYSFWYMLPEQQWVELSIPASINGWIEILGVDPERPSVLWFSATNETSQLWSIDLEGALTPSFEVDKKIIGFETIHDLLIVGGESGFFVSANNGEDWNGPWLTPEVACLEKEQDTLYVCSHNWQDDAAVMRTDAIGLPNEWIWEPVFSFSEVVSINDCPENSFTKQTCESLWNAGVTNGGFQQHLPVQDTEKDKLNNCNGCSHHSSFAYILWTGWVTIFRRRKYYTRMK
jgi:hypothetical protein